MLLIMIIIVTVTLIVIIQWEVKFYIEATPVPRNHMGQLGVVVMLYTCICEVLGSYLSRFTVYTLSYVSNAFYVYFCSLFGRLIGYLFG